MEIRPTAPFWAWDLIAEVERGERKPGLVSEVSWRTRRGTVYDRMIADARSGKIKAGTETLERFVAQSRERQDSSNRWSSGTADSWNGRITMTAGTDVLDQKVCLLHEIAHLLTPGGNHGLAWRRTAARIYRKYGGPEVVAWAIAWERKPLLVNMLKRRVRGLEPSES
jgi:hypothetical protein